MKPDPTAPGMWQSGCVQQPHRSFIVRSVIAFVGALLVAVGFVGLFFPVIPGIVLIASGLALLGRQYHWARTALDRVTPTRMKRTPPEATDAEAA